MLRSCSSRTGVAFVSANLAAHVRASSGLACSCRQWIALRPFLTVGAPSSGLCSASSRYDLDYTSFKERLENADVYLIDVREKYEYQGGKIGDAINVPCMVTFVFRQ